MKKIFIALMIITSFQIIKDLNSKNIIIPKESIRFRVIANSNSELDQNLKLKVKDNLEKRIDQTIQTTTNLEEARNSINNNLLMFEDSIKNTLKEENSNQTFKINYGMNYFPEKQYRNVTYPAGNYESLVVTLGDGLGENFWCVLFPPLCLLDAEENKNEKVEYHILVKDIINRYKKSNK